MWNDVLVAGVKSSHCRWHSHAPHVFNEVVVACRDLTGNNLFGSIPDSLGYLVALENMYALGSVSRTPGAHYSVVRVTPSRVSASTWITVQDRSRLVVACVVPGLECPVA